MRRFVTTRLVLVLGVAAGLAGCAARSQSPTFVAPSAAAGGAAGADNPLARVQLGMTKSQVREVAGQPWDENSYATGKVFIPFYFGNDARRTSWYYRGQGRVVFADGNPFGGGRAEVIRVDIDPSESGIAR